MFMCGSFLSFLSSSLRKLKVLLQAASLLLLGISMGVASCSQKNPENTLVDNQPKEEPPVEQETTLPPPEVEEEPVEEEPEEMVDAGPKQSPTQGVIQGGVLQNGVVQGKGGVGQGKGGIIQGKGGVVQGKGGVVQGMGGVGQGKGGIIQGKGGVVQGKGGVVQGVGGVGQGKGGIIQGKGGVVQGKGGVGQGKGGIIQGKGGVVQGKGGVGQGKGGVVQGKGGVGQGKGGIIQGKGGVVQGKGGVGQGKGGVVQGMGGVGQGKGGIIQGKGGVVQGKGGVGQGKGGVVQGMGGVGQGKGGIIQGKGGVVQQGTHTKGFIPNAGGQQYYQSGQSSMIAVSHNIHSFAGFHGYEAYLPAQNACSLTNNHTIVFDGETYRLERFVTSIYSNRIIQNYQTVALADFATILSSQLFHVEAQTLGTVVVQEGQVYVSSPITFSQGGLVNTPLTNIPVAKVFQGRYAVSSNDPTYGTRELKLDFDELGACLGLYRHSSGKYLGGQHLVLVIPRLNL